MGFGDGVGFLFEVVFGDGFGITHENAPVFEPLPYFIENVVILLLRSLAGVNFITHGSFPFTFHKMY